MAGPSSPRRQASPQEHAHQDHRLAESTRSLLHRVRSGDAAALDEICARYLPRLSRWAKGRVPSRARTQVDTDDLVQDTLLGSLRRLPEIRAERPESFPAYLRVALLNRLRKELRSVERQPGRALLRDSAPDPSPTPLEETIGRELAAGYEAALTRLSEADRSVLFLRLEMNLPYRDIAESLDKPSANAARVAAARALVRLAQEMES